MAMTSKPPSRPQIKSLNSTRLAPGFRFHPTDEELVSYYLKRKVAGQPIRLNPISDVDLYKSEPWSLPPHSRLHTRDLEWYFFTTLDRKYSNCCRTNRATEEGYWKTTGKDRPVRRRSRKVGMKKTLVYHAGRAPRGRRTNWVMHEYRLEDDGLSRAGVSQSGEQDICSNTEDPSSPMEQILKDEASVEDFSGYVDFQAMQGNTPISNGTPILNGTKENSSVQDQSFAKNNGYVQLHDIVAEEITCFTSDGHANDRPLGRHDDIFIIDVEGHSESLCPLSISGKLLDTYGVSGLPDALQICTVQHDKQVEPYDTALLAEDKLIYYDAQGYSVQYLENSCSDEASLVPSAGCDFLQDLMAYYDATDNTLHYARTDPSVSESSFAEAAGSCTSFSGAVENVAKSTSLLIAVNNNSTSDESSKRHSAGLFDIQQKDHEDKTLMKRLASMLESISAPPALASEPAVIIDKMAEHFSTAYASSFHVTARMIRIRNSTDTGCSKSTSSTLSKNCKRGFQFSYATNDDKVDRNSFLREALKCTFFSSFLGGGLYYFFISIIILASSYIMGIYVYNLSP